MREQTIWGFNNSGVLEKTRRHAAEQKKKKKKKGETLMRTLGGCPTQQDERGNRGSCPEKWREEAGDRPYATQKKSENGECDIHQPNKQKTWVLSARRGQKGEQTRNEGERESFGPEESGVEEKKKRQKKTPQKRSTGMLGKRSRGGGSGKPLTIKEDRKEKLNKKPTPDRSQSRAW